MEVKNRTFGMRLIIGIGLECTYRILPYSGRWAWNFCCMSFFSLQLKIHLYWLHVLEGRYSLLQKGTELVWRTTLDFDTFILFLWITFRRVTSLLSLKKRQRKQRGRLNDLIEFPALASSVPSREWLLRVVAISACFSRLSCNWLE